MRQQACSLQSIAGHQDHFTNICLRQSEQDRPRRAACADDHGRLACNRDVRNRPIKAARIGVGGNKCARVIAKHSVDRANGVAHIARVADKIERRNLVRDRDVASTPVGIGGTLGKITLQILGFYIRCAVIDHQAQLCKPEVVDQWRF